MTRGTIVTDSVLAVNVTELRVVADVWRRSFQEYNDADLDEDGWAQLLKHCQAALRDLDAERKELVSPATRDIARVNEIYREATAPIDDLKVLCKVRLGALADAKRLQGQQALAMASVAAQVGDTQGVYAALSAVPDQRATAGTRTSWEWYADSVDLNALPKEWLVLNETMLKYYLKEHAKSETIPPISGLVFKRRAKVCAK
jgi:hypothetical protein